MIRPVGPFRKMLIGDGGRLLPPYFPLGFSHLEEYYDARSLLAQAHGSNVSSWVDLSGNSRTQSTFVPDNPPIYLKTSSLSPKGQPLVALNGTDQSLSSGSIVMPNPNTRGYTFHWYANWINQANNGIPWQDDTGGRPQLLVRTGAGTGGWRDTSNTRTINGVTSGFHLLSWVFDLSGVGTLYKDGVALGTATWAIAYNANAATIIGCNQTNAAHIAMNMGFGCWYSDSHTAAQVALFAIWAGVFWGY